jgi:hypothetical protein
MSIADKLIASMADIDLAIARIDELADAEKVRLQAKKATLLQAKQDLNPKSERIIADLVQLGVLKDLS